MLNIILRHFDTIPSDSGCNNGAKKLRTKISKMLTRNPIKNKNKMLSFIYSLKKLKYAIGEFF